MTVRIDPKLLRTVHLVPLTAFDATGQIDWDVQSEHITRMYAAGMRLFLPGAGTGEFHNLSADEIVELVRITRDAAGDDAVIFAPVGYQIGHAIDVGLRSVEAGANGILFMPLGHPHLSDQGACAYYRDVLDIVQMPALIYKKGPIPSDALLLELAEEPLVAGVKFAVNDMHSFRKIVLADEGEIEWLCGSAERFAPFFMLAGATGFTTGAGNLCPQLSLAMHAAFAAGEYQEGLRLQQIILPIEEFRARDGESYGISMLKYAMTLLGTNFGPPRAPGRTLTAGECTQIDELMRPILAAEAELASEFVSVGLSAK